MAIIFGLIHKEFKSAVLLHNGDKLGSVPVGHSVELGKSYEDMKYLLEVLQYSHQNWKICCDLKMISIVLGLQAEYTKHPCFFVPLGLDI